MRRICSRVSASVEPTASMFSGKGQRSPAHWLACLPAQLLLDAARSPGGSEGTAEFLQYADVRTTLNVYTQGVPENLRTANDLVVAEVLTGSIP